ncbi:MAG: hypothetical protein JO372_06855, partial [Solirubrobacterales bacterium]|nr:hypothetical protein [Solirubrobacterales bacterium]
MPINPALAHLEALVGHWRMELYRAAFLPEPETRLTGSIDIEWIAEGAALLMRQGDAAQPPAATWIVGRDAAEPSCSVLY